MLALQDKIEARHKITIDLAFRAETQFRKEGAVSMKTGLATHSGSGSAKGNVEGGEDSYR